MPTGPAEQQPAREEPGDPALAESADRQDQDAPRCHGGKTLPEHFKDAMNEHDILGRLLAQ